MQLRVMPLSGRRQQSGWIANLSLLMLLRSTLRSTLRPWHHAQLVASRTVHPQFVEEVVAGRRTVSLR